MSLPLAAAGRHAAPGRPGRPVLARLATRWEVCDPRTGRTVAAWPLAILARVHSRSIGLDYDRARSASWLPPAGLAEARAAYPDRSATALAADLAPVLAGLDVDPWPPLPRDRSGRFQTA